MSAQHDEIVQWIIKGDHDLGTAKITFLHIPEYMDTVTFHCQQAVEKYLKSYLVFLSISFKFTHDLVYLLDLICQKDDEFKNQYNTLAELQSYSVEVRYPNETIFLTKEKVESSLITAKEVRDLIILKMGISVEYHEVISK
ncbi:MAG: HEPN domain-containing protein [Bacteroidota bacterium]